VSLRLSVVGLSLTLVVIPATPGQASQPHGAESPLLSRLGNTPESILKLFDEPGSIRPTAHTLTAEERRQLNEALNALPPLHRQVLGERLRTLSFLDGMPNTALTSPVDPNAEYRQYDITIRGSIFQQTASEWLTQKERTCFASEGSSRDVSIEVGDGPAILYALLHEGAHVVDGVVHITPYEAPGGKPPDPTASPFTRGVWTDRTTPAPPFRDPLLESVAYRRGGKPLSMEVAPRLYDELNRTPFASLYGSSNWGDDLAEYVALYHLTHGLDQPYRIVVREGGRELSVYEPMKSRRVLERVSVMKAFYEILVPTRTGPGKKVAYLGLAGHGGGQSSSPPSRRTKNSPESGPLVSRENSRDFPLGEKSAPISDPLTLTSGGSFVRGCHWPSALIFDS
jgi:hypothetical protein